MNLILDTHILLWWLDDNPKLPDSFKSLIMDVKNNLFVSAASIWEISIKTSIGKLEIPPHYLSIIQKQGINELPIKWEHAHKTQTLPMHHKDPFDRLLIAQSIIEKYTLLSVDDIFKNYDGVKLL